MMLQKTDTPELTPAQMAMLSRILRSNRQQFSYASIGRMPPGVAKKPRGDFEWVYTGNVTPIEMKRGLAGNGKPTLYPSRVYTLMKKDKSWRV